MAYWNPSPLGNRSITEGSAAAAVRVPKRRARLMSFNPPARISDVDAEQPSTSTASGPRKGSGRGKITNLMVRPRRYSVPNCRPDWSVNHPATPIARPPMPPGLPRTSTTNPRQSRHPLMASSIVLASPSGSKKTLNRTYPISCGSLRHSLPTRNGGILPRAAVAASLDGLFHRLGEPFGIEEDIESHVSDILRQPAPLAPDA